MINVMRSTFNKKSINSFKQVISSEVLSIRPDYVQQKILYKILAEVKVVVML